MLQFWEEFLTLDKILVTQTFVLININKYKNRKIAFINT